MEGADWFERSTAPAQSLTVAGNDIGSVEFTIRPTRAGHAGRSRSPPAAPRRPTPSSRSIIIEPEGVEREIGGERRPLGRQRHDASTLLLPPLVVEGSARAYLAVTGSYLTQTIEGLDQLLQMPFGCGEQNMILFAPDVFIARYLKETGQLKPEIMAKAEKLMITGYQRELTYRRSDGSFSAFGERTRRAASG